MPYVIRLAPAAERQLRKLDPDTRKRLAPHIDNLVNEPRPAGCKKLAGHASLWRIRVGDVRIIYRVDDPELVILVAGIGNRRDIYRDLQRLLGR